jgi:general secretion pathway protein L
MATKSLGIDLSDGHLTGVVLEQQRKAPVLVACQRLPLPEETDLAASILLLCEQVGWPEGVCVCGLPLSMLSVRTLNLPFTEVKKIAQALPFELEEQLIAPLDTLIYDFYPGQRTDAGSLIAAFALEREVLSGLLDTLRPQVDPEVVMPAMVALAAQIAASERDAQDFLVVHADLHSSNLTLVTERTPIFCRRLSHPEPMIVHPPFSWDNDSIQVIDPERMAECIRLLSRQVELSLDYFRMESRSAVRPERVVLTGPLAEVAGVTDLMAAALQLPLATVDLLALAGVAATDEQREQWRGDQDNRALALALQGLKTPLLNFRRDGFAKPRSLLAAKRPLIAASACALLLAVAGLGFLGYDYRQLQRQDKAVTEEMTALYKSAFPSVTKVHDPYAEMQAKLKAAQGPESPTPLLVAEKRVLNVLADISRRLPADLDLRVSRLSIDRETVLMRGTTGTFNAVETIKSALSASDRYKSVQIVSATADKDKKEGTIRFEIQMQLGGL